MSAEELLESDALRAFAVFAEHRNFTSAAAALRISQPSLHAKIGKLAAGLGIELYRREGRGLTLTDAGQRLAAFAEDAHRRAGDLLGELGEDHSVVRVAAGRGTLRWVISDSIRRAIRAGTSVQLQTANREAALASLAAGHCDLAVIAKSSPPPALRSRLITSYPQILVLKGDHPLAARKRLRVTDLDGLDLVVPPEGRPHRRALEAAMRERGVSWRIAAEVDGWDLLVHFADLGLGAAVVNGCVRLPARLRGIPVTDLPAVSYWAAWRPPRDRAVRALLEHLDRP
jgi:DNA-binding transcriptional LysR family regulator